MDALKFDSFPIHIQGYADIAINTNTSEVISGGNDCVIKIFDLKEKSNKQSYDIVDEIRAIAYNSSKNILSYSQGKSVYLIKNMISFSDPVLVTSFTSPVNTPPWIAAPTATASSGLTDLFGTFPKKF